MRFLLPEPELYESGTNLVTTRQRSGSRHHNAHYTASSWRGGGGELVDEKTLVKCTEQQGVGRRGCWDGNNCCPEWAALYMIDSCCCSSTLVISLCPAATTGQAWGSSALCLHWYGVGGSEVGLFVISLLFARQFFIPSERRLKPYQLSRPPGGTHFGPSTLLFLVVCFGGQRLVVRVNKIPTSSSSSVEWPPSSSYWRLVDCDRLMRACMGIHVIPTRARTGTLWNAVILSHMYELMHTLFRTCTHARARARAHVTKMVGILIQPCYEQT